MKSRKIVARGEGYDLHRPDAILLVVIFVLLGAGTQTFGPGAEERQPPAGRDSGLDQVAVAKLRQKAAASNAARTLEILESAVRERERWQEEVEPLLCDEAGRKIASDSRLVAAFRSVYERARPSERDLSKAKNRVTEILIPIRAALLDPGGLYEPPPELLLRLELERKGAIEARDVFQTAREAIEALARQASGRASAAKTLQSAMKRKEVRQIVAAV